MHICLYNVTQACAAHHEHKENRQVVRVRNPSPSRWTCKKKLERLYRLFRQIELGAKEGKRVQCGLVSATKAYVSVKHVKLIASRVEVWVRDGGTHTVKSLLGRKGEQAPTTMAAPYAINSIFTQNQYTCKQCTEEGAYIKKYTQCVYICPKKRKRKN